MLTFFSHCVSMLFATEYPNHILLVYAAFAFFTIVVMAPCKWDKKWMRIKASIRMLVFCLSFLSICCVGFVLIWIAWIRRPSAFSGSVAISTLWMVIGMDP